MKRFKQIMFYAIIIVIFIIFSEYMIKVGLRNTYKTISGKIKTSSPEITVTEAKSTDVDGYVQGIIKNNSDEGIEKIYIKVDLYSKRDVNLGTEYLEIKDLNKDEIQEFEIKYKYSNVDYYEITCVNEK